MTNRQPLSPREIALLDLYSNCQLSMDVFEFYQKWNVTQKQIAAICGTGHLPQVANATLACGASCVFRQSNVGLVHKPESPNRSTLAGWQRWI